MWVTAYCVFPCSILSWLLLPGDTWCSHYKCLSFTSTFEPVFFFLSPSFDVPRTVTEIKNKEWTPLLHKYLQSRGSDPWGSPCCPWQHWCPRPQGLSPFVPGSKPGPRLSTLCGELTSWQFAPPPAPGPACLNVINRDIWIEPFHRSNWKRTRIKFWPVVFINLEA